MRAFDASSIVYAWDNYPKNQFPSLWYWIAVEVQNGNIVMSDVAFEEVGHVAPECAAWLEDKSVSLIRTSPEILKKALDIKTALGIEGDQFHGDGVDENDIIIIAAACTEGIPLTSDEAVQNDRPKNTARYKIPAVCGLANVSISCQGFLDFIKDSRQVFG